MSKKYELTDDTIQHEGSTLHRIRALIDIPVIKVSAGDLGGYVESEKNLSHEGNCWVDMNAVVKDRARVEGDAAVEGDAVVKDHALVSENAWVRDNSEVFGDAWVHGYIWMSGNASVCGGELE